MLLFGGISPCGVWVSEVMECFDHCLMVHPSSCFEDSSSKSHVDCDRPAQEISEEKNISKWLTDHSSDVSGFAF